MPRDQMPRDQMPRDQMPRDPSAASSSSHPQPHHPHQVSEWCLCCAMSGTEIAYGGCAVRSPVQRWRMVCMGLRARYAVSGTEIAHALQQHGSPHSQRGMSLRYEPTRALRPVRTHLAYPAKRHIRYSPSVSSYAPPMPCALITPPGSASVDATWRGLMEEARRGQGGGGGGEGDG
eukprot:2962993-Rhodomonas_salina.1